MHTYSEKQIQTVKTLAAKGMTRPAIAKKTGVNVHSVTYYLKTKNHLAKRSQTNNKTQTVPTIKVATKSSKTTTTPKRTTVTYNDSPIMKTIVKGLSRLFQDVERTITTKAW